jgi:hypothetical protein
MGFPCCLFLILFVLGSGQPILPCQEVSSAPKPGQPTTESLCISGAFHITGVAGVGSLHIVRSISRKLGRRFQGENKASPVHSMAVRWMRTPDRELKTGNSAFKESIHV